MVEGRKLNLLLAITKLIREFQFYLFFANLSVQRLLTHPNKFIGVVAALLGFGKELGLYFI